MRFIIEARLADGDSDTVNDSHGVPTVVERRDCKPGARTQPASAERIHHAWFPRSKRTQVFLSSFGPISGSTSRSSDICCTPHSIENSSPHALQRGIASLISPKIRSPSEQMRVLAAITSPTPQRDSAGRGHCGPIHVPARASVDPVLRPEGPSSGARSHSTRTSVDKKRPCGHSGP